MLNKIFEYLYYIACENLCVMRIYEKKTSFSRSFEK